MDRGAWWATVCGVSKSQIQWSTHALGWLTSPTVAAAVSKQTILQGPPTPQETQASASSGLHIYFPCWVEIIGALQTPPLGQELLLAGTMSCSPPSVHSACHTEGAQEV